VVRFSRRFLNDGAKIRMLQLMEIIFCTKKLKVGFIAFNTVHFTYIFA